MSTSPPPSRHTSHATLDRDLDRDRAASALDAERRRLQRVVAELAANELDQRSEEEDLGEIASVSQHPADVASETFEREVELGLIEEFRDALDELAVARQRFDEGSYGTCERCRRRIRV